MYIALAILILIIIGLFIAFLVFCVDAESTSSGDEKHQDSSKSSAYTGLEWGDISYNCKCCENCLYFRRRFNHSGFCYAHNRETDDFDICSWYEYCPYYRK